MSAYHMTSLDDTHCHLDFAVFDTDRDSVLKRAYDNDIETIIIPGVTAQRWPMIKTLCAQYPNLHCAYGLHPMFMADHQAQHINDLARWVEAEKPIAIGECGLDFYIKDYDKDAQLACFEAQVKVAYESKLPLIIHARKSLDIVLKIIRKYRGVRGVLHAFSGSEQQARAALGLGFYLGIGGAITYDRATRLRGLVQRLPLEAMVLETDAPDMPAMPYRGSRNEPGYLIVVAKEIAHLRNCDIKDVAQCTHQNSENLFGTGTITR